MIQPDHSDADDIDPLSTPSLEGHFGSVSTKLGRVSSKDDGTGFKDVLACTIHAQEYENIDEERAPMDFICLVDTSKSMTGGFSLQAKNKLDQVMHCFQHLLSYLGPNDRFCVYLFAMKCEQLFPLQPMTRTTRQLVSSELSKHIAHPDGGTDLLGGLRAALEHLAECHENEDTSERTATIWIFSDGIDQVNRTKVSGSTERVSNVQTLDNRSLETKIKDLVASYEDRIPGGFSVNTFGFGDEHDDFIMSRMADLGHGTYAAVNGKLDAKSQERKFVQYFADCLNRRLTVVVKQVKMKIEVDGCTVERVIKDSARSRSTTRGKRKASKSKSTERLVVSETVSLNSTAHSERYDESKKEVDQPTSETSVSLGEFYSGMTHTEFFYVGNETESVTGTVSIDYLDLVNGGEQKTLVQPFDLKRDGRPFSANLLSNLRVTQQMASELKSKRASTSPMKKKSKALTNYSMMRTGAGKYGTKSLTAKTKNTTKVMSRSFNAQELEDWGGAKSFSQGTTNLMKNPEFRATVTASLEKVLVSIAAEQSDRMQQMVGVIETKMREETTEGVFGEGGICEMIRAEWMNEWMLWKQEMHVASTRAMTAAEKIEDELKRIQQLRELLEEEEMNRMSAEEYDEDEQYRPRTFHGNTQTFNFISSGMDIHTPATGSATPFINTFSPRRRHTHSRAESNDINDGASRWTRPNSSARTYWKKGKNANSDEIDVEDDEMTPHKQRLYPQNGQPQTHTVFPSESEMDDDLADIGTLIMAETTLQETQKRLRLQEEGWTNNLKTRQVKIQKLAEEEEAAEKECEEIEKRKEERKAVVSQMVEKEKQEIADFRAEDEAFLKRQKERQEKEERMRKKEEEEQKKAKKRRAAIRRGKATTTKKGDTTKNLNSNVTKTNQTTKDSAEQEDDEDQSGKTIKKATLTPRHASRVRQLEEAGDDSKEEEEEGGGDENAPISQGARQSINYRRAMAEYIRDTYADDEEDNNADTTVGGRGFTTSQQNQSGKLGTDSSGNNETTANLGGTSGTTRRRGAGGTTDSPTGQALDSENEEDEEEEMLERPHAKTVSRKTERTRADNSEELAENEDSEDEQSDNEKVGGEEGEGGDVTQNHTVVRSPPQKARKVTSNTKEQAANDVGLDSVFLQTQIPTENKAVIERAHAAEMEEDESIVGYVEDSDSSFLFRCFDKCRYSTSASVFLLIVGIILFVLFVFVSVVGMTLLCGGKFMSFFPVLGPLASSGIFRIGKVDDSKASLSVWTAPDTTPSLLFAVGPTPSPNTTMSALSRRTRNSEDRHLFEIGESDVFAQSLSSQSTETSDFHVLSSSGTEAISANETGLNVTVPAVLKSDLNVTGRLTLETDVSLARGKYFPSFFALTTRGNSTRLFAERFDSQRTLILNVLAGLGDTAMMCPYLVKNTTVASAGSCKSLVDFEVVPSATVGEYSINIILDKGDVTTGLETPLTVSVSAFFDEPALEIQFYDAIGNPI
ncbi:hypothetical protein BLNAU_19228 [Blattamonas nauphoetae]|uniref:VWFA domain-containing protein n=1 Tax=Blattamonas nauphoetae TaxID=2049346 RepID=A0ABQ9X253_9EUKA|nr:hypothetical protein BLNAU_19228 [Blattamonas nauphoetae]